jgi:hypothetical protein
MMGSGVTATLVEMELSIILIMMYITGNGLIISAMGTGSMSIVRIQNIKVSGKMTVSMGTGLNPGLMALTSRGNTKRESNMDKESTFGQTTLDIEGNGNIIK